MPRARAREINAGLLQPVANGVIDILCVIIGVHPPNAKRELFHHVLQGRMHLPFAQLRDGHGHFIWGLLINRIDVIHPFALIAVALMHRVHAQIARLSIRLGSPPLPNRAASRTSLAQLATIDGVGVALAQAVEMRHRDLREPLKAGSP